MTTLVLPDPELTKGRFASIPAYSDEALYVATGVRIAFTTREGGVSEGPYNSLNLGSHVKDDLVSVQETAAAFSRLSHAKMRPCLFRIRFTVIPCSSWAIPGVLTRRLHLLRHMN